ncbi:MAG: endonuclease III [Ignavibacteriales bacterium]
MTKLFLKNQIDQIYKLLSAEYPDIKPALKFKNPFELLVATILSAQCTDERVNEVTKNFFKVFPNPKSISNASQDEIEKLIFSTGYYRQKAKNLIACCKKIVKEHAGQVPQDFDELVKLPGVGRKTASVIAGNVFGIPAIAVDTHVKRLSNLLGLVNSKNPDIIEMQLKLLLPEKHWVNISHLFASHGKKVCVSQKPKCNICVLKKYCPSYKSIEV